ncbi:MAG: glycogen debranching N-terminal domain-containing protein [Bacillota bacterium]
MTMLTLKEGELFLLADRRGDVPGDCFGLYLQETQFLDRWTLTVAGRSLTILSARAAEVWRSSILLVAGQELGVPGIGPNELEVLRRQVIADGALYEEIRLMNRGSQRVLLPVALEFGAGFADLFEYRGFTRDRRGEGEAPEEQSGSVLLGYLGLDGVRRRTLIRFLTPPDEVVGHSIARWQLTLEPGGTQVLSFAVAPVLGEEEPPPVTDFARATRQMMTAYADWTERVTQIEASHADGDRVLKRSIRDLRALMMDIGHGPFPAAGIPWFATLFGRDSLITAYQALLLDPSVARGTLRTLAAYQGEAVNPARAEAPGKILHELRRGEMANLGEIPFGRYYGSVDATPLFLVLLGEYHRWTGDDGFVREMLPHARAAAGWMQRHGDLDGDGLLEYEPTGESGLAVQSWKDSPTSLIRPDGTLPEPPIAVVEVQGYAYEGYRSLAQLLERLGEGNEEALALRERAERVRLRFEETYWMESAACYAIALDRQKAQVQTLTSDPGHCLWSTIASPDRARAVADRLMEPHLFSGWGIRTMSAQEPGYSPLHYHNGTVWPHDNGLIAMGFARYGLTAPLRTMAMALLEASRHFEEYRLPEVFCGYAAEDGPPVPFPSACSPQAWAAGAPLLLVRALLGLEPDVPAGRVRLAPCVPEELGGLRLTGLRIGQGCLDLVARHGGVEILRNTTGLVVEIEER